MSVKERIKQFIKYSGIKITAFEESISVANGYVNSISKGIGRDKMEVIIEKYPKLDIEWLLTGKGSMIRSDIEILEITNGPETANKLSSVERDLLVKKVKYLEEMVEWYKKHIEFLSEQLSIKNVLDKQRIQDVFERMNEIEKAEKKKSVR